MVFDIVQKTECKICKSKDLECFIKLPPIPFAGKPVLISSDEDTDKHPVNVYVCKTCKHIQLLDIISPDIYKDYFYTPSQSKKFKEYIYDLSKNIVNKYGKINVIEIGSSNGYLLKCLKNNDCNVLGFEPSNKLAMLATDNYGINCINDYFSQANLYKINNEYFPVNVIIIRHVLEHIEDLTDIMTAISQTIDKEGVLIIEVPYWGDIIKEKQFYAFFSEHVSYFSVNALENLLGMHKFKIISIERSPLEGGSILIHASQCDKYKINSNVKKFKEYEKETLTFQMLNSFSEEIKNLCFNINNFISYNLKEGKSLAGWGAGQRGISLLNFCGITKNEIQYVVDINPEYQNKYLPGCRIPIVPPKEIYNNPVDGIIVFASSYIDQIKNDNKLYVDNGGRFISIIPELEWL